MPDHSKRIKEIKDVLASGVTSMTTDGTSHTIDPDSLRKELRDLMADDDTQRRRKPRVSSINTSGLF